MTRGAALFALEGVRLVADDGTAYLGGADGLDLELGRAGEIVDPAGPLRSREVHRPPPAQPA